MIWLFRNIEKEICSFWRTEPVNGTYDAFIGAGKLNIIKNQELKQKLAEYAAEVQFGIEDEKMAVDLASNLVPSSSSNTKHLIEGYFFCPLDYRIPSILVIY
jgi:hypothetical protein